MEKIEELDREACKLLAELFKKENSCFVEGKTIEEITEVFEGMGPPRMDNGVLMRNYFNVTAQMYDLKDISSNTLYEKDVKKIESSEYNIIKWGKINNEIGFILTAPKGTEK